MYMWMPDKPEYGAGQRSSIESFIDEYQLVRLWLSLAGLGLIVVLFVTGGWNDQVVPIGIVLLAAGSHAGWCRLRRTRSPLTMLWLDLTLWGWVMTVAGGNIAIPTATLAFLTMLTVLFSDRYWMVGFVAYNAAWYSFSYLQSNSLNIESLSVLAAVILTVASEATVIYHVKRWLGRLDANRSQMIGTVSHELRNNLTGMMGLTELVAHAADLGAEEARELAGLAYEQASDASMIVEDLLTAARIERSAFTLDVAAVDLNEQVATTVRRFVGEGTEVTFATHESYEVMGDALRIRQILRNLISNAVRYGGLSIQVEARQVASRIELVVSDDGDGVPQEDEKTIFLPYRRSINSRRDAASVGLGLWICRQLAHAMGGDLEYRRSDDRTRFVLLLDSSPDLAPSHQPFVGAGSAGHLGESAGEGPAAHAEAV